MDTIPIELAGIIFDLASNCYSVELTCKQWRNLVRDCGLEFDTSTEYMALAAMRGHLSILEWARSLGCPWDTEVLRSAAEHDQLFVLLKVMQRKDRPEHFTGRLIRVNCINTAHFILEAAIKHDKVRVVRAFIPQFGADGLIASTICDDSPDVFTYLYQNFSRRMTDNPLTHYLNITRAFRSPRIALRIINIMAVSVMTDLGSHNLRIEW